MNGMLTVFVRYIDLILHLICIDISWVPWCRNNLAKCSYMRARAIMVPVVVSPFLWVCKTAACLRILYNIRSAFFSVYCQHIEALFLGNPWCFCSFYMENF